MATASSTIKIKRSATSGAPNSLAQGELAYSYLAGNLSNGGDRLYFGTGDAVNVIGGKYFTDMMDHTPGTLTANSAIITDSSNKIDVINVGNITVTGSSSVISSTNLDGNINLEPNGAGKVTINSGSNKFALPGGKGTSGQVLVSDGAGNVNWGNNSFNDIFPATANGNVIYSANGVWEQAAPGATSGVQAYDAGLAALAAKTSTGVMVQTGADTYESRTLVQPESGITITNPDGVAGNITFALNADLAAVEGLATYGFAVRTAANTWTTRSVTGSADRIVVTDGDGVNSAPTIDLASGVVGSGGGTFLKFTVDTYGRVVNTTAVVESDVTALVDDVYLRLDGTNTPTANLSMGGFRLTNVGDPTGAQDAATKNYVDNAVTGLSWKQAVHALGNTNVALSGSTPLVIDGHTIEDQDRVLLINQTNAYDDGIYVVTIAGGSYTMARSSDCNTYQELNGAAVFVQQGATYADSGWVQTATLSSLTTGTTQNWVQFSGAGAYVGGTGISINGNVINFNVGRGLQANGSNSIEIHTATGGALTVGGALTPALELVLDSTVTGGLSQANGALRISAAGVTNAMIQNSTLTLDADSGTGSIALGGTLDIVGVSAQGISTSIANNIYTVTAADAAYAQKGVASFNVASFSVTDGAVSIASSGITNSMLANSATGFAADTGGSFNVALGSTMTTSGTGPISTATDSANSKVVISIADASTTVKGAASFSSTNFDVASGAVSIKNGGVDNNNLVNSSITFAGTDASTSVRALGTTLAFADAGAADGQAALIKVAMDGGTANISLRAASTSALGVASFSSASFDVSAGAVTIKNAGVNNTQLQNSAITFSSDNGSEAIALGGSLAFTGNATQGISTSESAGTLNITAANASTSQKGVASFSSTNFDVAAGAVSIKNGGVDNGNLVNSSVSLAGTSGGPGSLALGQTLTVNGDSDAISTTVSGQTITVSARAATTTQNGVAHFNSDDFTVVDGLVSLAGAAALSELAADSGTAAPSNGSIGVLGTAAQGITTSATGNVVTLTISDASASQKGVATFGVAGFTVSSGAVSLAANVAQSFGSDGGTAAPTNNNLNIVGTAAQGVSTSASGNTVTITVANATTASKGVASFSNTQFTVSSGAVTLNTVAVADGGTGRTSLTANQVLYGNGTGAVATSANFTFDGASLLTVGGAKPVTVDGNTATISAAGTNSDLVLQANGTGQVIIGSAGSSSIASGPGESLSLIGTTTLSLTSTTGDLTVNLPNANTAHVVVSGPSANTYAEAIGPYDNTLVNAAYVSNFVSVIDGGTY